MKMSDFDTSIGNCVILYMNVLFYEVDVFLKNFMFKLIIFFNE